MECTINHVKRTITITKAYAKAASIKGTNAYTELLELHKDLPTYKVVQRKIDRSKLGRKTTHKGLTIEEMRRVITEREGEDSIYLQVLAKAQVDKVPYPKIKEWFFDLYEDYGKRPSEMPDLEGFRITAINTGETAGQPTCA